MSQIWRLAPSTANATAPAAVAAASVNSKDPLPASGSMPNTVSIHVGPVSVAAQQMALNAENANSMAARIAHVIASPSRCGRADPNLTPAGTAVKKSRGDDGNQTPRSCRAAFVSGTAHPWPLARRLLARPRLPIGTSMAAGGAGGV
jgi:hypothetical protein